MQPACLFIIAALWIVLEPNNLPARPEYYFGAPEMFEPPRNPYADARSPYREGIDFEVDKNRVWCHPSTGMCSYFPIFEEERIYDRE